MHGVPLPRPVRAGGGAQSRPMRAGRCPLKRARLAAQHYPTHGRGPHDDCQAQKKRLLLHRPLRRPRCRGARRRPSASGGKRSKAMSCGALWATKSVKCGCGWSSNGPGGASWAGRWAAGSKPPCAGSGKPCRRIADTIAGSSLTKGKPTLRCCPAGSPGPAPKAKAGPTRPGPLINYPLRRRCGVPGRKSCSFSKSLAVHTARIELIIANYNQRILSD